MCSESRICQGQVSAEAGVWVTWSLEFSATLLSPGPCHWGTRPVVDPALSPCVVIQSAWLHVSPVLALCAGKFAVHNHVGARCMFEEFTKISSTDWPMEVTAMGR